MKMARIRNQLRVQPLNVRTPISIEREFSLFKPDSTPLSRAETQTFIRTLQGRLSQVQGRRYEVVEEVAGNSFEVKICFSTPAEIRGDMLYTYRVVADEVRRQRLLILGISPPFAPTECNEFFTTIAFPATRGLLAPTNSIHIHIGGYSQEELTRRYRIGNIIAPLLLDISQASVIDGEPRGRAVRINRFLNTVPRILGQPWSFADQDSYSVRLENSREVVEGVIRAQEEGAIHTILAKYPGFTRRNGHGFELHQLTADKIFHLARIRFDKLDLERGLAGSVEIRALDGQHTIEEDLAMIQLVLGALAYFERMYSRVSLNDEEIEQILRSLEFINNGPLEREQRMELFANALNGTRRLSIGFGNLPRVASIIDTPPYMRYLRERRSPEAIVNSAARDFMSAPGIQELPSYKE